MYLAFLPFGSVLVFLFTFIIILLCTYIVKCFYKKDCRKWSKKFLTVRTRPRPHNCFQRTTGEFEGVLQTPLMPCPAVCCKVSEAVCPVQWQVRMETGKLCFSVSVGVAYGTGQIVTVKGGKGGDFQRKYYPYLDWLKAERAVSAVKRKISKAFRYSRKPSICPVERLQGGG